MIKYFIFILCIVVPNAWGSDIVVNIYDYKEAGNNSSLTYSVDYWNTESMLPNPCYLRACQKIGVGFHPGNGEPTVGLINAKDMLSSSETFYLPTIGDLGKLYVRKYGLGIRRVTVGAGFNTTKLCYGMKYTNPGNNYPAILPGNDCAYTNPGPPLNACRFSDYSLEINHGVIAPATESRKKVYLAMYCLSPANVAITFKGTVYGKLELGNKNVQSSLYINGSLGAAVIFGVLQTVLEIESVISPIPSGLAGNYQGSTTMVVNFY